MIDYLVLSAELSLVALVAIACLRSAPARWRLGVALVALFVAVLPWAVLPAVPIPVTSGSTTVLDALPLIAPFGTPEAAVPSTFASPSAGWELPLASVLTAASTLGLAAFAWLALRQRASVRRWRKVALDGDHLLEKMPEAVPRDCRIRILPGSGQAAASGLLHPTVWIGEHHVDDERCTSVLLHEMMHLQRRHPLVVVALTFLRCLLWWQPFVWLWVWLARRELEHDCDEACAELLGRDPYRRTLASLIHDAGPQPGLALMGRRSFNLDRVRSLEKAKRLRLRHRVATVFALCLVPLLALDLSVQAGDGNGTTRAKLLERVEEDFEATNADTLLTKVGDLLAVRFNTTLIGALRVLANQTSRPVYLHPDVDAAKKVEVAIAGTQEELIRAVAKHVGLAAGVHPTSFVVAEERLLTDPRWIDRAVVLSGVPNKRIRLDIDLEVDGESIPTPVDLIVGQSNWTGFEAGGCLINLVAQRIDDEGVVVELRHFRSEGAGMSWEKEMPYGMRRTLIDGKVPGMDGDWCRVSLLASAYELDWSRDPSAGDGESENTNDVVETSLKESGDDTGTEPDGG